MSDEKLDPQARAALVRELFETSVLCDFGERMLRDSTRPDMQSDAFAELRREVLHDAERRWPEFQAATASSSDERLVGMLEEYVERADHLGLTLWRIGRTEQLARGEGVQAYIDSGCEELPVGEAFEKLCAELREDHAAARNRDGLGEVPVAGKYQVWHDPLFPVSTIRNLVEGEATPFPEGFTHVADVEAGSLEHAVALTQDVGGVLGNAGGPHRPWEKNGGVDAQVEAPRSTSLGDVVVDPQGQPFRVTSQGFRAIPADERPGWQTIAEVAEGERAGRAEDEQALRWAEFQEGNDDRETHDGHAGSTEAARVRFLKMDCVVEKTSYPNGRPALILLDAQDGEEVTVATVNLPDIPAGPNEVFIKDYSENEGMLKALEEAGVVKATGERVRSGFVDLPRAELQPPFREKSYEQTVADLSARAGSPREKDRDQER